MALGEYRRLVTRVGVPQADLAAAVGLSERTLRNRKSGRLNLIETDRLNRVLRVMDAAVAAFGSEENARRWLIQPAYGLGQHVPLSFLDTEPGTETVLNLLGAIRYNDAY